ncbi:MAG: HAD-IA family hydrolase [Aphanocapsa sp. GSE-SYN-MK-11-07L]|jgi:beta-phosphoglucomutase family hydrolase|nr:HAD-IA family hydrolase [Aphanocapsa sp. GSE-SYN-MK-11-07L]
MVQMQPLEAIIFDMDGVLCDTMPYHLKAWDIYVAQTPALAVTQVKDLSRMGGKRNSELLAEVLGRPVTAAEVKQWGGGKEAIYRELIRDQIVWLPGLVDFLRSAEAAGLKLGLGTSACKENTDLILSHQELGRFFAARAIETDVQRGKPDPQVYLLVAERLGVQPAQCLVFEDAVAGVEAAIRAGMTCWGVLTTHTATELAAVGAEVCIQDFTDPRLQALV